MRVKRTVATAVMAGAVGLFGGAAAQARDGVHTGACVRVTQDPTQWNYRLVAVMHQLPADQACATENIVTQQAEELLQELTAAFNANR